MNLKKSRVLSLATALLMTASSVVGISAANAGTISSPWSENFDAMATYTGVDFDGNTTSLVSDQPAGAGFTSGQAIKMDNQGAAWAGTKFVLPATTSVISGTNATASISVYSPDALDRCFLLKLEGTGAAIERVVHVTQGWQTLNVNYAANYDSTKKYNVVALMPNLAGVGCATWTPGKALTTWYVDNISFPGATAFDGVPVVVNRTTPSKLVNFEATDAQVALIPFGGYGASVVTDATAQGSTGSTSALKIVASGECWAGVTFVKIGDTESLVSSANPVVKANIYSPVAGKVIKLKLENKSNAAANKEVDVTSVAGWNQYSFNFTGFDPGIDYNMASLFADFSCGAGAPAKSGAIYYADDFAFNGATPAAITDPGTGGGTGGNTGGGTGGNTGGGTGGTTVVTVTSRLNGNTADNSIVGSTEGWAQYYAAGLGYFERGVEVGSTTRLSYTVTSDGAPYANKTVHLLLGKEYSGSTAKVSVNGVAFTGVQKTIDLTTDANGQVSFDVVNSNFNADADPYQAANLLHPTNGKHLFVQLTVVGEKGNQDVIDILDLNYYQAQAATPPTVMNLRLADWNATNSFDGTHVWGDGGLGDWFDANTGYFAHYVKAGSTFNLRYSVKNDAGVSAPNGTVVTLTLGAAWSGSNGKFTVNGVPVSGITKWGANGQLDQATTTAVVSNGYITVSVTSEDLNEDATPNPGSATANPDGLNPLFMQVKGHVEGNYITHQDWVNIVATQAAAAPTISSISGTSGKYGQAIDIVGTNLADALGDVSVSLFTAATSKTAAVTTAVSVIAVSADGTRMTIRSPNKTQKGNFKVTTSAGTATSATAFSSSTSLNAKPAITFAASVVKEVGQTLTLSGANIASSSSIKIGTVSAAFTVVNASTVSVIVPEGVVSGSTISATNAAGTTTTTKLVFQAAVITTATASGRVGNTVTITGKNLVATAISFAGNKTAKAVVNNGTTLTFVVPAGALTGPIKITTGAGSIFTDSFTVVPPAPTVASFTPATGKKGVAVVTVKGTNLLGATVTVGSVAVTLSAGATATSFKFVIPAGASTGKINVTTAGGTASSTANLTVTN